MGRIKSTMIKKAARQLLDGENNFTEKFNDNKIILGSNMPSKPLRNKIAGYIARLKKMKRIEQIRLSSPKIVTQTQEALPAKSTPKYE